MERKEFLKKNNFRLIEKCSTCVHSGIYSNVGSIRCFRIDTGNADDIVSPDGICNLYKNRLIGENEKLKEKK